MIKETAVCKFVQEEQRHQPKEEENDGGFEQNLLVMDVDVDGWRQTATCTQQTINNTNQIGQNVTNMMVHWALESHTNTHNNHHHNHGRYNSCLRRHMNRDLCVHFVCLFTKSHSK